MQKNPRSGINVIQVGILKKILYLILILKSTIKLIF